MNRFWRINFRILATALSESFAWRTDLLFYRLYDILEPVAMLLMWGALYAQSDDLVGYTKEEMLTYILVARLFDALAVSWSQHDVAPAIREGKITPFLLKPISHARFVFWHSTGNELQSKVQSILVTFAIIFFLRGDLILAPVERIAAAIALALGAYVMNVLFGIAFGYVAFWLGSIQGFTESMYIIRWMFNGHAFPLDILGRVFQTFALALPFAYSAFVPAQVYLGRMGTNDILLAFAVEGIWIAVLWQLTRFLWKRGLKAYEGIGI